MMNVFKNQWIRSDNNIKQVIKDTMLYNGYYREYDMHIKLDTVKVSDTPRDLIQVGDLIMLKGYWDEPLLVSYIDKQGHPHATVRTSSGSESTDLTKWYNYDKITKILTPNSNGGYDLQWEKQ